MLDRAGERFDGCSGLLQRRGMQLTAPRQISIAVRDFAGRRMHRVRCRLDLPHDQLHVGMNRALNFNPARLVERPFPGLDLSVRTRIETHAVGKRKYIVVMRIVILEMYCITDLYFQRLGICTVLLNIKFPIV